MIHHAAVLAEEGHIRLEHLPEWFMEQVDQIQSDRKRLLKSAVRVFETNLLRSYLEAYGGDVRKALRHLGVARSSFYRKLRRRAVQSQ